MMPYSAPNAIFGRDADPEQQQDHPIKRHTARSPTLLMWGDQDALFSRTDQDRFMATLPAAQSTVYEETGHCPNWERPERVAADIAALVLHS